MGQRASLGKTIFISLKPLPLALLASLVPGKALALPEGLVVRGGSIGVSQPDGSTLLIQQGTNRAAGDWRSFNIGVGERVNLQQPSATSLMLARVTGGVGTEIFGQLSANGGLLLLNPHGVLIGPGAVINTASFAAGTLTMDPAHFMQGGPLLLEHLPGAPADAAVINRGTISVADAGLVALIAPQVINQGLISARLGTIQLASGTAATVDLSGDGLMQVALDPAVSGSLLNQGQLQAQFVRIGASEAQDLIHAAVNLDGLVQAHGPDGSGGSIVVASGGDVKVNGQLDATGGATASGGTIKLLGDRVALLDQARVDVSGGTGGGEILIGGNQLGQGPEPNATVAVIVPGAQVKADALNQGDGGRVILWSDLYTGFYGNISARGGSNGGKGGFVETSSKNNLQAFGMVDAAAPRGSAGLWLLDPTDITISNGSSKDISFANTSSSDGIWTPATGATIAVLNASTLLAQLEAGTNVEITTGTGGTGLGDISFDADLKSTDPDTATLKLKAANDILFGAALDLPNVSLEITQANNVSYATGSGATLASLNQVAASGTTLFYSDVTTKAVGGFLVNGNQITVNAGLKAEQGDFSLKAGTGGLDLRRVATTISMTTLNGNILLDSQSGIAVDSKSSTSPIPVTASNNLTINAATGMTVNGPLTLKSSSGAISLTGMIDGSNPTLTTNYMDSLTLEATNGTITANNAVGATQPLNGLTVAMSAGTTFLGRVSTAPSGAALGTITITDTKTGQSVDFKGDVSAASLITKSKSYQLSLTGSTNTFASAVDFLNTGAVTLGDSATDTFAFNKGLSFSGNAPFTLAGGFTTGGSDFNGGTGAVSLAANTSINTAGGAISVGGNLSGAASTLTIDAGNASSASFKGGLILKDLITTNKSYTISLTGAANSFTNSVEFENTGTVTLGTAAGTSVFEFLGGFDFKGNDNINVGGTIRTPGVAQKFGTGSPTLLSNSSFDSAWNGNPDGANISLGGNLSAPAFDLTVNAGNKGAIEGGGINLNLLSIANAGSLTIAGDATLNNLITGTGAYPISFNGAVNAFSKNLLNEIKFENKGVVSLGNGIADESIFGAGFNLTSNVTALKLGGNIRTSGDVIIAGGIPTTLLASATLDSTYQSNSGHDIHFGGTIDGSTAGAESLTLTSGQGTINFDAAIGGTKAIGALTASSTTGTITLGPAADIHAGGAVSLTAGGGISSAADITTTAAAVNINSNLTLTGDQVINTASGSGNAAGANINFGGTITDGAGSFNLDLNAGSGGVISASAADATGAITINNLTISNAASASFAGNVQINDLITSANAYGISLTGASNSFAAQVDVLSSGALTLGDGGDQFAFNGGIIATAPSAINLNGNVSAVGTGLITLGDTDTAVNVAGNATIGGASTGAISLGHAVLADGVTLTAGDGSAATPINLAAVSGTAGGASSSLALNTGGAVNVSGAVDTDIGTVTIINSGGTIFAGNVQINTLVTSAKPYAISFAGVNNSFAQKVDFLNAGLVTLGDASGTDAFLFDAGLTFTGNAASAIGGTIRSSADTISFGSGGVTLLANSTVDTTNNGGNSGGANINFGGTITDGANSFNLDLNAGSTGSIHATAADAAGAITINLLKISNAAPNSATFAGNVQVDSLVTTANPYSISFTGANNRFTQKVDFLNTGTVTLGDASGTDVFLFDGGLAFSGGSATKIGASILSSADTIDFGAGATTLISNTSVDTTNKGGSAIGGAISLASTVSGSTYNLTLDAGSGGAITSSGVDAAGAITLKNLTISNASNASFAGNLTLNSLITTANPYGLSLSGGNNSFAQLVTTLNTGTLTLGNNSGDVFLFDNGLSVSGNSEARLAATIRSTADPISFSPVPVTLTASSTVDATNNGGSAAGAAITFGGAVNGTVGGAAENLAVRGGSGNVSFNAAVGDTADLGAISIYTGGETLFNSSVKAVSLFTDQPGTAVLNGDITTTGAAGAQINEWTVSLHSNLTIDTAVGHGVVVLGGLGGTIDSETGETNNLTINANSGNVTLNSVVGSTQRLGDIAVNTSGATLFNAGVTAKSLITDQPGTAALNGNVDVNGKGGVQINELTIGLNSDLVITSASGPVVLGSAGGKIDSQTGENNGLTINAGTNDVTLNAVIGATQRLGDIAVNTSGATLFNAAVTAKSLITDQPGTAALNGNVDVNGKGGVQINELTIGLNDDLVITSTSGPVVLGSAGGKIDSQTGENNGLTINAGTNDVTLNAVIGATQRLGDIAVNTSGATLFNAAVTAKSLVTDQPGTAALNGNVDVNGKGGVQINELTIGLNSDLVITSASGPVVLGSAGGKIDSQTGENNGLTINAGTNDVTLNAAIGSGSGGALGDIVVNTAGATLFNSTITAASLFTDQPGTAALGGDITLSGAAGAQINEANVIINRPVTINTTAGNGLVRFAGAVDSRIGASNDLTVRAGTGAITFDGLVGSTTKLNNLNLYGGDININANVEAWNVIMQANNLNFNADIISPGYGTPGVSYGYHTFVGAINLTHPVTIQGNIGTINGTRVFTGTETIDGFTLSRFYNDGAAKPDLPNPPSLLNYQLGENQAASNQPAASSVPVPPMRTRAVERARVCLEIDTERKIEGCPVPEVAQRAAGGA